MWAECRNVFSSLSCHMVKCCGSHKRTNYRCGTEQTLSLVELLHVCTVRSTIGVHCGNTWSFEIVFSPVLLHRGVSYVWSVQEVVSNSKSEVFPQRTWTGEQLVWVKRASYLYRLLFLLLCFAAILFVVALQICYVWIFEYLGGPTFNYGGPTFE